MIIEDKIKDLIDEYQHRMEELDEELKVHKRNPYLAGKIGVYNRVIDDLQGILEVDE